MTTYHFPLRTSPVLISALLSILGVAIALGIIEMTYRSMESPHLEPHFARPHFYYIPPGAHNFRDQSYSFTKPENTFRTVVIGDSFTFGPSMQFDDAFPKRLERILNYSPGALRSEVINFGESGFATVHEVNVVKTALEFSPDLVIHEITLNDAQIERYNPNRDLAAHRFGELTLSYPLSAWHSLKWVLQRMKNHRSIQAYIDYHLDSFQAGRYWD
ncbi:MAG: SGNH/GDSL hydrolase family protein, partial [Bdellovibrionales bacterium]|nr:SGNH/GDSL hydrolase family protein [Bdellovibrionales bacterium]